jgi:hypothetical protein
LKALIMRSCATNLPAVPIAMILFMSVGFSQIEGAQWREARTKDEVILVRAATPKPSPAGQIFARRGNTTSVLISPEIGEAGRAALADLARYLPLACGCRVVTVPDKEAAAERMIILATSRSRGLLDWLGLDANAGSIGEQECMVLPRSHFPNQSQGVALIGGSGRGLLNGLYTLLEMSAGVWWEPLRSHDLRVSPSLSLTETVIESTDALYWEHGDFRWTPKVADRVLYMDSSQLTGRAVDWASRNRLSHLVISTPDDLPFPKERAKALKNLIAYAQGLGLRVLFLNVTHRLPGNVRLAASSPRAISESTQLFVDLFKDFGLDGMAWHTASEGIELVKDKAYEKEPRSYWEAEYFQSYYRSIRSLDQDAVMVMLMGWVYMNPARKLAKMFPDDIVAWVVPNTPIIDAARTDLDSYGRFFRRVWYWLYVRVSQDGLFPTIKLDYLETYFREAIRRQHGLAPQGVLFGNNAVNSAYFTQVARDGLLGQEEFLSPFAERYYGSRSMSKALLAYQEALKDHRNWNDNIQTTGPRRALKRKEVDRLGLTLRSTLEAARETRCPLIRDRLRILAITALRCLWRGTIEPPRLPGKQDKAWKRSRTGPEYLAEFRTMAADLEAEFADLLTAENQDLFGREFHQIKVALKEKPPAPPPDNE